MLMSNEELAKVEVSKPVTRSQEILNIINGETPPEDRGQAKLCIVRIHEDTATKAKPLIKKK
jgi:hypothetical protein